MAERRKTGNQSVQITPAGGTKRSARASFTPNSEYTVAEQRAFGVKDVTDAVLNNITSTFAVSSSVINVHELKVLVEAAMGRLTDTVDEESGLTTSRGTFSSVGAVNHRRVGLSFGEPGNAEKMENGVVSELGLTFNRNGEAELTATVVGKRLVADPDFATTGVAQYPSDQLLPTFGIVAIGKTEPTFEAPLVNLDGGLRVTSYGYALGSNVEEDSWFDGGGPGASNYDESTERTQEITAWAEHNDEGIDLLDALAVGRTIYSTYTVQGSNGSKLTIMNTLRVTGTGARETNSTKYGSSFTLRPVYNAAWGGATKVEIVAPTLA